VPVAGSCRLIEFASASVDSDAPGLEPERRADTESETPPRGRFDLPGLTGDLWLRFLQGVPPPTHHEVICVYADCGSDRGRVQPRGAGW
jgi:hypothetical protein